MKHKKNLIERRSGGSFLIQTDQLATKRISAEGGMEPKKKGSGRHMAGKKLSAIKPSYCKQKASAEKEGKTESKQYAQKRGAERGKRKGSEELSCQQ